MKRTQIQLDDRTYHALRQRAFQEHRSISAVVRDTLSGALNLRPPRAHVKDFSFIGAGRSRHRPGHPVSEHHDEALAAAVATRDRRRR